MRKSERSVSALHKSESGIVILILAMVIPALLVLAALVAFPSYSRLTHAELQSAADASAHAAALALCSNSGCYDAASQRAVDVLSRYSIHRRDGNTAPIVLDASAGPHWEDANEYEVEVVRGAWWPNGAPASAYYKTLPNENRFILLDSEDGSPPPNNTFGANVPNFVAANAVYVKITLKNYRDPLAFASPSGLEISADAIAVSGNVQSIRIAPFAVPACAIVDEDGAYHPESICQRDFFFARRDRYCAADDPNCNVTPGMFGTLTNEFSGMMAREMCSWIQAPVASDVFGFVGSPGIASTEESIVSAVKDNGGFLTHIGDKFYASETGLTTPAAFGALTEKMTTDDPPLGDGWLGAMRWGPDGGGALGYPYWEYYPGGMEEYFDCSVPGAGGWGACNSIVFRVEDGDSWSPNAGFPVRCKAPVMGTPVGWSPYWFNDTPRPAYWPTKAAVVAWDNMEACQSLGAGIDPPPPPSGAELHIIGYVDLNMYDLDIGARPPAPPSTMYTKGSDYWPNEGWCDQIEQCENGEEMCWQEGQDPYLDWNTSVSCDSTHTEPVCDWQWTCHDEDQCTTDPDTGEETCGPQEVCGEEYLCEDKTICCGIPLVCYMVRSPWCSAIIPWDCNAGPGGTNLAGTGHDPWGFSPPVAAGDPNFQCDLVRGRVGCSNTMVPSGITHEIREASLVR